MSDEKNLSDDLNDMLGDAKEGAKKTASPLAEVTRELSLIADLGVELLHIMPPFRMGLLARKGIGSPYAVADYLAIDPEFGSKAEWFALVRKAHALGLKIILGFMPNHTARDHVWISEDPENYVRDDQGQPGFDFDWSDTAKLNYRYPPLRQKVIETLRYWLEGEDRDSGVDGYRMDMAHMINDLGFWNEAIPELESVNDRPLLLLAECYGLERNLDLFQRGFQAAYDDDFYKITQYGYARDKQGKSRLWLDPEAEHNGDFTPRLADWKRGGIAAAVQGLIREYQTRAPQKLLARYVDNHDEGRGIYRFGPEACRVMMDLAACMPQSMVFTFAGQEAGALNRPPIHEYFSICDKGFRLVEGDEVRNVEGIEFEGNQFFRTAEERTQAISEMRKRFTLHQHPVLQQGDWNAIEVDEQAADPDKTVVAFSRSLNGDVLSCLFNLGHEKRDLKQVPQGKVVYGQMESNSMAPFSTVIIQPL